MRWINSLPLWVGIVTALVALAIGRTAKQRSYETEAVTQTAKIFDATAAYFAEENVPRGVSVAPGGVRDISYGRSHASLRDGGWFSAEGILAEHELPLSREIECKQALCIGAESMRAGLPHNMKVDQVALVEVATGTTLAELAAEPLHLVIALDRSSSMRGAKLETAKAGLRAGLARLGRKDRVSLVTFANDVTTDVVATPANDSRVLEHLDRIEARHGTDLEHGLRRAFDIARAMGGRARVLLLTDEQPTAGTHYPEAFTELIATAARNGIGVSIVGVGDDFGVELGHSMASIAGANMSYVRNAAEATSLLGERLESVVTEVATHVRLTIEPAGGRRVTRVFGVPATTVELRADGSASVRLSTVFASERRGGIVVAFGADDRPGVARDHIASLVLEYRDHEGRPGSAKTQVGPAKSPAIGIVRAHALVDEITTIEAIFRSPEMLCDPAPPLDALQSRLLGARDPALARELDLISRLRDDRCAPPQREFDPPPPDSAPAFVAERSVEPPRYPIMRALFGFLLGFLSTLLAQRIAPSITVQRPTARTARTLAVVIPMLTCAAWLGHRGTTMLERATEFENEVEGIGATRGHNEVDAVRTKAKAQVGAALGLLLLAFVTVRLRREAGARGHDDGSSGVGNS